ncbi:NADH-quinone oxidoreductase subunit J, partial (plasmid) [Chromobacterium amazonense]|nr:NADH-quinone oxidoreductase subunit J [Chromobacterium amazonense]
IGLTMRTRKDSKVIDPAVQVKVRSQDRVRIVKMDAVKKVEEAETADSGEQQA